MKIATLTVHSTAGQSLSGLPSRVRSAEASGNPAPVFTYPM